MIEKALKSLSEKVDEAEIFQLTSKSAAIKTKRFSIDMFKEKGTQGYGIRVIKDKKMGFYFSNVLNDQALERAVKVAKSSQRDEHLSLPEPSTYKDVSSQVFELELEEGIKMAEDLVSACKEYEGVFPTTGTVSWGTARITVANTNGVYGEKAEFTVSLYLGTVAKGKEPATGFHFEVSREKDIDAYDVGSIASRLAKESLNAERVEAGMRNVILRPMAVTELLESALIPSFSADNVQRGRSKLQGRINEEVFQGVNIVDDATLEGGLMSERFDDEGAATQRTTLVDRGVLKGFLYDTYTANKEEKRSTGNAARPSHASLPSVGPSNFIISGEDRIDEENGALVVHGLVGAHTANPISGDFSCETRNAFLDGRPVKKAIVSGNIFDVLASGIRFGEDVKQYSSVLSPSIELPDVTVVG